MAHPTLRDIMLALDALGAAVSANKPEDYRAALATCRELGCTAEQIDDAYAWRNHLRRASGLPPVTFTIEGETATT